MSKLLCKTHGKLPWKNTIICAACGRVWRLANPKTPDAGEAPPQGPLCTCGNSLVGTSGEAVYSGTARAICEDCFKERWSAQHAN